MSPIVEIPVDLAVMEQCVREYLRSPESADRHSRVQWALDNAMAVCLEENEVQLAFGMMMLVAFRSIELDGDAAGLLASRMVQITEGEGPIVQLVGAELAKASSQVLIRRCRTCGCTQERACAGGCRWVEDDLCSRCATYPFPACLVCDEPAPRTAEVAYQEGWTDGYCPECKNTEGDR